MSQEQTARASMVASHREARVPFRVLFVGRLTRSKGVDRVLDACALCGTDVVGKVTIVGDGPERGALESQAHALGLKESVRFTGALAFDRVLSEYASHDLAVLLSDTEGWPKALAEAMAHGMVAIGSDSGFVSSMLSEGRGVALQDKSAAALARAICSLANDPSHVCEIQKKAAEWASRYTLDSLEHALISLLQRSWGISASAAGAGS